MEHSKISDYIARYEEFSDLELSKFLSKKNDLSEESSVALDGVIQRRKIDTKSLLTEHLNTQEKKRFNRRSSIINAFAILIPIPLSHKFEFGAFFVIVFGFLAWKGSELLVKTINESNLAPFTRKALFIFLPIAYLLLGIFLPIFIH